MNPVVVNVGHVVNCTIIYLDQNGNPMLTTPTPDAAPTWSDAPAPAGCATLVAAPGGLTATDTAVAVGADVISLSLSVGGVAFSATQPVTIDAAPQVLTSIEIDATVV
jgi:hypothetical protein